MMMNGEEINVKISKKNRPKYGRNILFSLRDAYSFRHFCACQRIIAHETNFQTEVRAKTWECVCCGERFRDCDHELQYCSRVGQE